MKIHVYTFCWNELAILQWAVSSWKRYADRVTIFDNGSTDGGRELLQAYGFNVVDVRSDSLDNRWLRDMKNECWKEARGKADIVVVGDMDEIIGGSDPRGDLERMHRENGTMCRLKWYNLMWDKRPTIDPGQSIEDALQWGCWDAHPKALVFNPNAISSMNYGLGAHNCEPRGDVRMWEGDVYLWHVNHGLSLEDRLEDYRKLQARRGENDLTHGYGCHYGFSEERIRSEWNMARSQAVNLRQIFER